MRAPEGAAAAADRPKHYFVDLHAKRRFNKKFCETPKETVAQMILTMLTMLNPRGKGCCFKHISLITLRQCISLLNKGGCDTTLKPANAWQCLFCGAMHSNDEEHGVERECCWVCGHEHFNIEHVQSEYAIDVDMLGEESSSTPSSPAWEIGDSASCIMDSEQSD